MKDLPDTLFIEGTNIELTKTTNTDEQVASTVFNVYENVEEPFEYFINWIGPTNGGWAGSDNYANGCLLSESLGNSLEDEFADTYTVQILSGDSPGTYTVTRRSVCVWSESLDGEEPSGVRMFGGSLANGTMVWEVRYSDGSDGKSGDLNSPVGNYGTPTTRATVS